MLTKEATSSTVVATSSGLICHSLAAFFSDFCQHVVKQRYFRQVQIVGGIYVLHTVICFFIFFICN